MTFTKTPSLTTTIPTASGTYWLTGYYEARWGTVRFNLDLDNGLETTAVLAHADWPTTWAKLHTIVKHSHVEPTMRSVMP